MFFMFFFNLQINVCNIYALSLQLKPNGQPNNWLVLIQRQL